MQGTHWLQKCGVLCSSVNGVNRTMVDAACWGVASKRQSSCKMLAWFFPLYSLQGMTRSTLCGYSPLFA